MLGLQEAHSCFPPCVQQLIAKRYNTGKPHIFLAPGSPEVVHGEAVSEQQGGVNHIHPFH